MNRDTTKERPEASQSPDERATAWAQSQVALGGWAQILGEPERLIQKTLILSKES